MKFTILFSLFAVCCMVRVELTAADGESSQLHQAVRDGSIALVSTLIGQGADVNSVDEHKNTPLHLIGGINDSDNQYVITELLVNAGADIHAKNAYDKTPLDLATTNRIKDVMNKKLTKN